MTAYPGGVPWLHGHTAGSLRACAAGCDDTCWQPRRTGGCAGGRPTAPSCGSRQAPLGLQLPIPSLVPLCCERWPQCCQGVASAWTLASTEGTGTVLQRSFPDAGLPLVVPTAARHAEPPSPETRPKRHAGWGFDLVLGGMSLLCQLWPAAQGRVACSCTQQLANHKHIQNIIPAIATHSLCLCLSDHVPGESSMTTIDL